MKLKKQKPLYIRSVYWPSPAWKGSEADAFELMRIRRELAMERLSKFHKGQRNINKIFYLHRLDNPYMSQQVWEFMLELASK